MNKQKSLKNNSPEKKRDIANDNTYIEEQNPEYEKVDNNQVNKFDDSIAPLMNQYDTPINENLDSAKFVSSLIRKFDFYRTLIEKKRS